MRTGLLRAARRAIRRRAAAARGGRGNPTALLLDGLDDQTLRGWKKACRYACDRNGDRRVPRIRGRARHGVSRRWWVGGFPRVMMSLARISIPPQIGGGPLPYGSTIRTMSAGTATRAIRGRYSSAAESRRRCKATWVSRARNAPPPVTRRPRQPSSRQRRLEILRFTEYRGNPTRHLLPPPGQQPGSLSYRAGVEIRFAGEAGPPLSVFGKTRHSSGVETHAKATVQSPSCKPLHPRHAEHRLHGTHCSSWGSAR